MKNRFLYLPRILFLKSSISVIIFVFFSLSSPSFNLLVLSTSFASIFIFQLFIVLSDFTIRIQSILWSLSYLFGLSVLLNLNKDWFFISWKYQSIIFLFVILSMFTLRFISIMNKRLLYIAFLNNVLYSFCLWILVMNDIEEELYFDLTKIFTVYMILFAVFISLINRKTRINVENKRGL